VFFSDLLTYLVTSIVALIKLITAAARRNLAILLDLSVILWRYCYLLLDLLRLFFYLFITYYVKLFNIGLLTLLSVHDLDNLFFRKLSLFPIMIMLFKFQ